jgi:uncharacterized protein YndB with AHSA1/START domain
MEPQLNSITMKVFVKILIGTAIVLAILLLLALFTENEYRVEREVTINKPNQEVFDYVKHQKNQDHYNTWVMRDPHMRKEFSGTDGTPGFVYAWDGNEDAGKGEQEITGIQDGERIDLEIRFIKPFEGIANIHLTTEALAANRTKVKWGMQGLHPFPLNLMNLFMDTMLGKDLEKSLANLKGILEKP